MIFLSYLSEIVHPGDIIITMGAGDIWTVGQELAEQLNKTKVFLTLFENEYKYRYYKK